MTFSVFCDRIRAESKDGNSAQLGYESFDSREEIEMTAFVSILLTVIIIVIGLFIRPKKAESKKTVDSPENGDSKTHDEVHDIWYWFGFVDDSPNVAYQVVAGPAKTGKPKRYMASLEYGFIDQKTGKVHKERQQEFEDNHPLLAYIRNTFGKRWYGIPIINNVKRLTIDRVVSKGTVAKQESLSDELSASTVVRFGLYGEILRPTFHKDIDSKDNVRFSVISYITLYVMDFAPAFNIYADNFLIIISKMISGYVSKRTFLMDYDGYKSEGNAFDPTRLAEVNELLTPLGVVAIKGVMGDPELHPDVQGALEQKAKAKAAADAKREEGLGEKDRLISVSEGTKQKTINEGEGEAQKIERIARARAKRFTELYNVFIGKAFSEADAVRMANEQVIAEFSAEAIGKLTTYVAGGSGVQVSIPTSGKVGS